MRRVLDHTLLIVAVLAFCGPVVWVVSSALAPESLATNWQTLTRQLSTDSNGPGLSRVALVSFVLATGVSVLTTLFSFLAAFAIAFFNRPFVGVCFWIALASLYFPIEARMLHTFEVVALLGLTSSFPGLILPVLQLALGTFFFRQRLSQLPPHIFEAARLDAAGPIRCLIEIALPLSWSAVATVGIVSFILGWNQYLWPLMVSVNDQHWTLVRGLERVQTGSGAGLMLATLSLFPPLAAIWLLRHRIGHSIFREN